MRIALVEDNLIFCFLFKKFLEEYPSRKIDVQLFLNGKEAWDYFDSIKESPSLFPDMIFIDINMPFINGWELIEKLLVNNFEFIKKIPVYIISSSKSSLDIGKCEEYQFITDYIIKPIERETIYAILDKNVYSQSSTEMS